MCEQLGADIKKAFLNSKRAVTHVTAGMENSPAVKLHHETIQMTCSQLIEMCGWHCVIYDWGGSFKFFCRQNTISEMSTDQIEQSANKDRKSVV